MSAERLAARYLAAAEDTIGGWKILGIESLSKCDRCGRNDIESGVVVLERDEPTGMRIMRVGKDCAAKMLATDKANVAKAFKTAWADLMKKVRVFPVIRKDLWMKLRAWEKQPRAADIKYPDVTAEDFEVVKGYLQQVAVEFKITNGQVVDLLKGGDGTLREFLMVAKHRGFNL